MDFNGILLLIFRVNFYPIRDDIVSLAKAFIMVEI